MVKYKALISYGNSISQETRMNVYEWNEEEQDIIWTNFEQQVADNALEEEWLEEQEKKASANGE